MKHIILLLSILALCVTGCNQGGLKGLGTLKGQITLDGSPIDVSITFHPVSGVSGQTRMAGAVSDASGRFQVTTLKYGDGLAPGDYVITVSKMVLARKYTEAELERLSRAGRKPDTRESMPKKYATKESSELTCTIKAGKNDDLILLLTSR